MFRSTNRVLLAGCSRRLESGERTNPGYRVRDKLENKLHEFVCDGERQLRATQRKIASDWQALYKSVFGVAPSG